MSSKPGLLGKKIADDLLGAVNRMLQEGVISAQSKRELEEVSYALRTVQRR